MPERQSATIEIRCYGTPASQGSKRFVGYRNGKGVMIESSKTVRPWRQTVAMAAVAHGGRIAGPVDVELVFTLRKPASAPKTRQTWPDRKPDVDKLCRACLDSLSESGIIEDDARVVRLAARKVFPGEDPDALHIPGAVIRIKAVNSVKP